MKYALLLIAYLLVPMTLLAHEVPDAVTIHMYDDHYEPTNITIEAGTTVVFENKGDKEHWPASNIHPTHTLYPGSNIDKCGTEKEENIFDACRGIGTGEEYSFVFTQAGSWKYHDHLFPNLKGTIVVTGTSLESEAAETEVKESFFERFINWGELAVTKVYFKLLSKRAEAKLKALDMKEVGRDDTALRYWLKLFSPKDMMIELLSDTGGGSSVDCHTQAHHLGRVSYELYGSEAFQFGDSSCHSGFYHGAMETFLAEKGLDNLTQNIKDVCSIFPTSFGHFECLHGVGHGLMAYEDYDLPQSLEDCKLLGDSFSISSCYGGVFMENVVAGQGQGAIIGHDTKWANHTDPHFPCNALDKNDYQVRYDCYQMQTSWMLTIFNFDYERVAKECLRAGDMTPVCFKSLGRDISGNALRNPQTIVTRCATVTTNKELHKQCIDGAVHVIVDFWGEKLEDQAVQVCKLLTSQEEKQPCYELLTWRLKDVFADKSIRSNRCSLFEDKYQYLCKEN